MSWASSNDAEQTGWSIAAVEKIVNSICSKFCQFALWFRWEWKRIWCFQCIPSMLHFNPPLIWNCSWSKTADFIEEFPFWILEPSPMGLISIVWYITMHCIAMAEISMSIEKEYFWGDFRLLPEFSQFLGILWCIFFHKKQSFCLCLFPEMRQTSTKIRRPSLIIFYSSQIQHFLVFQQNFRYKKIHIKWQKWI